MREIKFRAWDKVNSNMIYSPIWISDTYGERSGVIGLDGSVGLIFKSSRGLEIKEVKNQFILQQFTGLKDKNGVEIYEGDIIEFAHIDASYPKEILPVLWDEQSAGFVCKNNQHSKGIDMAGNYDSIKGFVIGNIYQNPETTS